MTTADTLAHLLHLMDLAGVAVFAATGALVAARRDRTLVTFIAFAIVAGVGGGTVRDLLLGAPVFWVKDPTYISVSMMVAGLVWAAKGRLISPKPLMWLDAVGLAAYAALGAAKAASLGASPLISVVMGVVTATFGGVLRDLFAGRPTLLVTREIYISAAALGAVVYVALRLAGASAEVAFFLGAVAAFALRAAALTLGWSLPGFDGDPDEV